MGTVVDNAVHIEVEVVDNRDNSGPTGLIDEWIPFTQPSIKLWDTWKRGKESKRLVDDLRVYRCAIRCA